MSKPYRIHSDETKQKAIKLRDDGKSYVEIGTILNITKSLARRWCDPIVAEKERQHCREYHKEWYSKDENKKKKSEYFQNRQLTHYDHIMDIKIKSRNKHRFNTQLRARLRYKNDMFFKWTGLQRQRLRSLLKINNIKKEDKIIDLLGCNREMFLDYIQKQFAEGMTWENHGKFGWHFDHIIPCDSFDLTDPIQRKKCFHYTNFQPLWWRDNLVKNNKINLENTK